MHILQHPDCLPAMSAFCPAPQKYVTVHTAHGTVTLAFDDSAEAQLWFAALKDAVASLKQVLSDALRDHAPSSCPCAAAR